MTPFSQRNLIRAFSIVLFTGLLYSYKKVIPFLSPRIEHIEFVAISMMLMVALTIMLIWANLGPFTGLVSFVVALLVLYGPLTDLNPYYYSVLIGAFFMSGLIGQHISRKMGISSQKYTVNREKIQEDTNLILNHVKKRREEVRTMGEKVSSMLKLKNIADSLSLTLDTDKIISIAVDETFTVFGEDSRVLVFMYDENSACLNLTETRKGPQRRSYELKNGGIFDRWVMKNAKSLLVKDKRKDFRFSVTEEESRDDPISVMIKPLIIENKVLGVLRVDSTLQSRYEQHELRMLDIIGELTALALENARLYRQTEELAIKDSLTGLYVNRYFKERLDEEIKRALRSDISFAFLMMDIDDFKGFNDKNGHIAGDAVLKKIGEILSSKASPGDIVARYGGEEFAFLTLNCDRKQAVELAENIRKEVETTPVLIRRKKCSVTMSVGVAMFPGDAKMKEDVIWEADTCLYKAKSGGKNKVCSK
jgi:diguanylate cyclase (GGDEF)-like protein